MGFSFALRTTLRHVLEAIMEQVVTSHLYSQGEILKAKLPPVLDSLKQPHGAYCYKFQTTHNYLNYLKRMAMTSNSINPLTASRARGHCQPY